MIRGGLNYHPLPLSVRRSDTDTLDSYSSNNVVGEPWWRLSSGIWAAPTHQPSEIRNQNVFGSCAGQSIAFWMSRFAATKLSGTHPWTEGRRIAARLSNKDIGASLDNVLNGFRNTGSPAWEETENNDTAENVKRYTLGDDLARQLDSDDNRPSRLDVWKIDPGPGATALMRKALLDGCGVVFASGLRDPFWGIHSLDPVGSEAIGGNANGHAQAVVGVDDDTVTVVNSWGVGFGESGCWRATHDVFDGGNVWEIRVFRAYFGGV